MSHSLFIVIKGQEPCLTRGFESMAKSKHRHVNKVIKTAWGPEERRFLMVDVDEFDPTFNTYESIGSYWADVITGSLYEPATGRCLSSTQISLLV